MRTLLLLTLAATSQATTITADLDLSSYAQSLQRRFPGAIAAPDGHVFMLPGTGSGSLYLESGSTRTPTLSLTEETATYSSSAGTRYGQVLFGILEYSRETAAELWVDGVVTIHLDVTGSASPTSVVASRQWLDVIGGTWSTGIAMRNWAEAAQDDPVPAPEPSSLLLLCAGAALLNYRRSHRA